MFVLNVEVRQDHANTVEQSPCLASDCQEMLARVGVGRYYPHLHRISHRFTRFAGPYTPMTPHQPGSQSRVTLRTAVVGVGYLGRFHAQKYQQIAESKLLGVVDANPETAQR